MRTIAYTTKSQGQIGADTSAFNVRTSPAMGVLSYVVCSMYRQYVMNS